ncbi:uncharacterized protein [Periplaneta americana]|uniref:uncharacterized protein isoform X1 n=1 Tax=Periplaneta americana TaxID=6978 RepID=UPI0037E8AD36
MDTEDNEQQQINQANVSEIRKMVKNLDQHHGLQLVDAVPVLLKLFCTDSMNLKSLHLKSLIQVGFHVLEVSYIKDNESNEFSARLLTLLLNSSENEDREVERSKKIYIFAAWCNSETISMPLHLHERIAPIWKNYLQEILFNLVAEFHSTCHNEHQQQLDKIFTSPDVIIFLNICRHSPLIFQATVTTFTNFLINMNGCSIIVSLMSEFIKLVEYHCKESLPSLFPKKYKELVSYLRLNPDINNSFDEYGGDFKKQHVLELLVTAFREEKYNGLTLVSCFPAWLFHLVKYYSEEYDRKFFSDFCF